MQQKEKAPGAGDARRPETLATTERVPTTIAGKSKLKVRLRDQAVAAMFAERPANIRNRAERRRQRALGRSRPDSLFRASKI